MELSLHCMNIFETQSHMAAGSKTECWGVVMVWLPPNRAGCKGAATLQLAVDVLRKLTCPI